MQLTDQLTIGQSLRRRHPARDTGEEVVECLPQAQRFDVGRMQPQVEHGTLPTRVREQRVKPAQPVTFGQRRCQRWAT